MRISHPSGRPVSSAYGLLSRVTYEKGRLLELGDLTITGYEEL